MSYRNDHVSFSRLSKYEACPLAFRFTYVDRLPTESGVPLRFGSLVHAIIERLLQEVIDEERMGPLSEAHAFELLRNEWPGTELVGADLFSEAFAILRDFIREEGVVNPWDLLAVEQEFELPVGPFKVVGRIDRVNRIDDETIEIVDFKTNRIPHTREEVDESLQLGLYAAVAGRLWPWAKRIKLTFHLLRHGLRMTTERTPEQLEAALGYLEALGRMTEDAKDYPPRLNVNCPFCDHRSRCPAYREALAEGKREFSADPADLEALAREREDLVARGKILAARTNELDRVIKRHLKERDEIVAGGRRYSLFKTAKVSYPLAPTLKVLAGATSLPESDLLAQIAAVDKDRLDTLVKDLEPQIGKSRVLLLKVELSAVVEKSFTPRLWAREVKS